MAAVDDDRRVWPRRPPLVLALVVEAIVVIGRVVVVGGRSG